MDDVAKLSLRSWIRAAFGFGCLLEFLCWLHIGSSIDVYMVFMLVWGLAPYFVLFAAARLCRSRAEVVSLVVGTVLSDALLRLGFLLSKSSTAPLALIFIPFYVLLLFMPLSSFGTRFWIWLRGRRPAPLTGPPSPAARPGAADVVEAGGG